MNSSRTSASKKFALQNEVEILIQQVMQLGQRGAHREALVVAEHALARFPKSASLLNAAAIAAISSGNSTEAEALWQRCLQAEPGKSVAHLNLGRFYLNTRQYQRAEPYLRKAVALNPKSADALNCLGALSQALGSFGLASQHYQQALKLDPKKSEAINNLGICWLELNNFERARQCFERLLQLPGQQCNAHIRLGMLAEAQGQLAQAETCFKQALAANPGNTSAITRMVAAIGRRGEHAKAKELVEKALLETGVLPEFLHILAQIEYIAGNRERAMKCLDQALALSPNDKEIILYRALILAKEKNTGALLPLLQHLANTMPDKHSLTVHTVRILIVADLKQEALQTIKDAIKLLKPTAQLLCILGEALIAQQEYEEADAAYSKALKLEPTNLEANRGLGALLRRGEHYIEAEKCFRHALSLHPEDRILRAELANTLLELRRPQEASEIVGPLYTAYPDDVIVLLSYSKFSRTAGKIELAFSAAQHAYEIDPSSLQVRINLAACLEETGQVEQATILLRRIYEEEPDSPDIGIGLASLLLMQGLFDEGWKVYESRLNPILKNGAHHPYTRMPRWTGEAIAGKTLLIAREQGIGDELQFYRYLPLLKQKLGCNIVIICKTPLQSLFEAQQEFPTYSFETVTEELLPPHDVWTPLMSIPHIAQANFPDIPDNVPYLHVPQSNIDTWKPRLKGEGLKVGLVWKGNPEHKNDLRRSLPDAAALAPLWACSNVRYFSLQKGAGEDEASLLQENHQVVNLGPDIKQVLDTAAIMAQLDLVICVDTMAAHLAGALGVPCWVMLPGWAEWRWQIDRSDSPWYPDMRLYRQSTHGDWSNVVQRIAVDLQSFRKSKRTTF